MRLGIIIRRGRRSFSSSKTIKNVPSDGSFGKWINKEERGRVFGQYAEEYDAHRPSYPSKVFDEIMKRCVSNKDLRVIDVATGTGRGALAFSNYSQVSQIVATDVDAQMIEKAKIASDASFRVAKAESVSEVLSSEERGQFDVATVFQAFHWFDAQKVLKELRENVLKDGGILAVAVRLGVFFLFSHALTHTHTYSGTIAI